MKILFLHGWNSKPGGVKPTYLATHGHEVVNPPLPDDDFAAAVHTAQAEYERHQPDVIVGSSRGGAVAMNVRAGETPLVLLCPAWKKYGTVRVVSPGTVVLHSRADDVVPFSDSEELVRASGLPASALIEVGSDHRLADPEPLAAMLGACERATISVLGVDPASSKGLTVWDGKGAFHVPANRSAEWTASVAAGRNRSLVCWDSPLSFDPAFGLSDRPVDKILRAAVARWVSEGLVDAKAVSVLPFSGCSHWVVSCDALGLPFSRPRRTSYPLAPDSKTVRAGGLWVVEAHPAVALAVWWVEGERRPTPLPVYKNKKSACRHIAETLGFSELMSLSDLNDDVLDAYVAYRLGKVFLTGESGWVGDPRAGGYVLPQSAETKWQLRTQVSRMISASPSNAGNRSVS